MTPDFYPELLTAERVGNAVLVSFKDGKAAIYPAFFLYSAIELSEVLNETKLEQEGE